jgi:hypothetical protein
MTGAQYGHNSDIWHLRYHWQRIKPTIQHQIRTGGFRYDPVRRVRTQNLTYDLWSARDRIVLKAIALVLGKYLTPYLSQDCFHLQDRGGSKGAVRAVQQQINIHSFVFRSDVKQYYASMDHSVLMRLLATMIPERKVLDLLAGYLSHLKDVDGHLTEVRRGVSLSCSLSPLMGAVYLKPLDEAMAATGLFYARYMDDWVVLSKSRWQMKRAVKTINHTLNLLKIEKHPLKTFIGRTKKGFDFLGYRLTAEKTKGLGIAWMTVKNHLKKLTRLYEQDAPCERIGEYIKGWRKWVRSGVDLQEGDSLQLVVGGVTWEIVERFGVGGWHFNGVSG